MTTRDRKRVDLSDTRQNTDRKLRDAALAAWHTDDELSPERRAELERHTH